MRKFFITTIAIFSLLCQCTGPLMAATAKEVKVSKQYQWKVIRVLDGDTLEVDASAFLPAELKLTVRVLGIDTPEKSPKAKCLDEGVLAAQASTFTLNKVMNAKTISFSNIKWDKFGGRVLATVTIDGNDLSRDLIAAKLARPYHGEKKQAWCRNLIMGD